MRESEIETKVKKYLLYSCEYFYDPRGTEAFIGDYDNITDIITKLNEIFLNNKKRKDNIWFQVVEHKTMKPIYIKELDIPFDQVKES